MQSFLLLFPLFIYSDIVIAVMFRSARLRCPIEGEATTTATWRFVKLGTEYEVVVYQTSRVVDAFNDTLYANLTKDGRHELFIANTTLENAGDYYCLDRGDTKILHLIVLGKDFHLFRFYLSFSLIQQSTSLRSPANNSPKISPTASLKVTNSVISPVAYSADLLILIANNCCIGAF